jgi:hypothetical protein
VEVVRLLLDRGANVDAHDRVSLSISLHACASACMNLMCIIPVRSLYNNILLFNVCWSVGRYRMYDRVVEQSITKPL